MGTRPVNTQRLERDVWSQRFLEKISAHHKRNRTKVVSRILARATTARNSLVARSKKHDVPCTVTVNELRQLMYDAYGTKCKYCHKILTIQTMVIDHRIPISKGGPSTLENLQVICKTSNSMKGSLLEENFSLLLAWLETVPNELKRDISIRLSRGVH